MAINEPLHASPISSLFAMDHCQHIYLYVIRLKRTNLASPKRSMELSRLLTGTRPIEQELQGRVGAAMLVLTRKVGEKIAIGGKPEIVVTVVAIGGGRVRLGVEAEASIPVHRVVNQVECSRPSLVSE